MTPQLSFILRFAGASLLAGFLPVAACSADSADPGVPAENDGGAVVVPDSAAPEADSGVDTGTPDASVASKCGNFKVEPGETCDDGNTVDNDGCSATCKLESAFEGDICPGKPVTLEPNGALLHATVTGTTASAFNQYGSGCGGGSGKDVVYTFTPPTSGKAIVKLTANFPAMVSARSTCEVATTESTCSEVDGTNGGTTTIEVPVFQNTPAFLFVDGYGGSTGSYTLDVDVSQAQCGNGVAELPEACDDGNTTSGDGCSATCTLEAGGALTQCPGQPFQLTGPAGQPRKVSFSGDLTTQSKTGQGSSGCFFDDGHFSIYAVKSDIAGSLKANLLAGYAESAVHARSECSSSTYQVGCNSSLSPGQSNIQFPVNAGQWIYLIVGAEGNGGPYTLDVEVSPAACGNHVLDGNEECDDGNADLGDGCTPQCIRETLAGVDTCPGHAVTLSAQPDGSRAAIVSGTTVGLTNDAPPCQAILTSSAPDAIFAVTPDVDGRLTAEVTGPFNTIVSVLDRCTAPVGERSAVLACSYASWSPPLNQDEPYVLDGLGSGPKSTGAPVRANQTYYVVVDGTAGSAGRFELRLRIQPSPVCGNGVIEGSETCDDGGTDDNDGCSATCTVETTGLRNTCASAENVVLLEKPNGEWGVSVKSGTTNLTNTHNFGSIASTAGGCWARGRDAFFKVTAPADGVLRATAKSDAFDVILGMQRETCSTTTPPTACSNSGPKATDETLAVSVSAGDTIYVVVDSAFPEVNGCTADPFSTTFAADCTKLQEAGRFTLDVSVTPSGCGDGFFVPSPTEQCDDGNTINGDGCNASCMLEPVTNVDTCPGRPITFSGTGNQPRKATVTFSTATLSADYAGACGGDSRDGVVSFVAPISGIARAQSRNMLNSTVYARSACTDPGTEFLKKPGSNTCPSVVHDTVSFQVTAGEDYFVFVDGIDGAVGVPTLDVTIN